jgi:large subunit ribosomal protein L14e
VLLNSGPSAGRIAVIVEIIDHNRVRVPCADNHCGTDEYSLRQAIIDGPTTSVPRQAFPYRHLTLTPLTLTKLPRGAGSGVVRKLLEKEATVEKWEKSSWAQKRAAVQKRRELNDFGRFRVMLEKKARRDVVRKAVKQAS